MVSGDTIKKQVLFQVSKLETELIYVTGDERIELPPKVLETPIIPFDQSPVYRWAKTHLIFIS